MTRKVNDSSTFIYYLGHQLCNVWANQFHAGAFDSEMDGKARATAEGRRALREWSADWTEQQPVRAVPQCSGGRRSFFGGGRGADTSVVAILSLRLATELLKFETLLRTCECFLLVRDRQGVARR